MRNRSAERTARGQRLFVVSLIAVLLGFLVVVQLRSQALVARSLANQDNTSIALLINDLNHANGQLLQQSLALDQRQRALQQGLVTGGADTQAIEKELTILRVVAGLLPVHGPGLEIRIEGPVMDFELQDALNNLRNAGAEAAALNGYRIVDGTPIISHGSALRVAGHPVSSPYVLSVVGDPEQLETAADISASSLQTRVQVTITRRSDLAITEVVEARPLLYSQLGP
ncbi:MAG TPA: DUF881 domain-containing protein [Candidatus Limnocylindria bacterium]|nr:DUF881 domain-containing protein [Candidatus Limnocylindria bacterium]